MPSRGIVTSTSRRLCSRAWCTTIASRARSAIGGGAATGSRHGSSRTPGREHALPVRVVIDAARGPCATPRTPSPRAGVPATSSRPPASPPSGPRSRIQSAARMTSRLCSMTTQRMTGVEQPLERAEQLGDVVEVQARGRLVEQEQRWPACALALAPTSARCPASFSRCASPPDSVGTGWPEPQVVETDGDERFQARRARRGRRAKNTAAADTVMSSTSAMLRAGPSPRCIFTSRISGR